MAMETEGLMMGTLVELTLGRAFTTISQNPRVISAHEGVRSTLLSLTQCLNSLVN